MEQIDFGKIISAAAVSTLGVLSLIIVALGVIAFFFFKGSPEKVKLSVWWTMVVAGGLFAAAVVKQSDPREHAEPDPRPTGTPGPTGTPSPASTDDPRPQGQASPSATPTPTPSATATPRPADRDVGDLSGQWHDNDGYLYNVTLSGTAFSYQQWLNGMAAGYGQGTLTGRQLRYGYLTVDGSRGECKAVVAGDDRSISGTCTSGGQSWPFSVER